MALGLLARIRELERQRSPERRFSDIAARFVAYRQDEKGKLQPTGRTSPVYGGVWDRKLHAYARGAEPGSVLDLECNDDQLDYLLCGKPRYTGKGGRGSGKSEALTLAAIKHLLDQPGEHGQIVSPTYDLTELVWEKILDKLPEEWLWPKTGVRLKQHIIRLLIGSSVRFRSAERPRSLRGWGGSWLGLDEEADISEEAIGIALGSLRLTSRPQIFGAGTPQVGPYEDRFKRMVADPDNCQVFIFLPQKNPFISHEYIKLAATQMDERLYRQEFLAEFVDLSDDPRVFYCFDRDRHCVEWPLDEPEDITRVYTRRKFGIAANHIIGIDYNWHYPNYAVVWKVLAPNNWVALNIVRTEPYQGQSHAGFLAEEIKKAGYLNSVVVDDATEQFKNKGNSCTRLLRAAGFHVFHQNKNPLVTGRINATLAKLAPVSGRPTMFFALPHCEELCEAMERATWDSSGKKLDKKEGYDHVIDAATYPVAWCEPAATLAPRHKYLVAK